MRRITLFTHPECARCRRLARVHGFFDWFGRMEHTTATPPTGPLVPGAIAVTDHLTGETHLGSAAVRRLAREIPAYLPMRVVLRVPMIARSIDLAMMGCSDGGCAASPV